jgi:tRNA A-37 threonylcarbamoyl transferase component Bud32
VDSAIPGTLIADRYRLVRPLGAGSSATVWEASDTALDRTVALKLLHRFALANPTERERLRREARALAKLAHPRITIVFDYLEQAQPDGTPQPVLVTELLNGSTLADRLRSGPLPPAEGVAVCAQLADALRAAHQAGIVHRDVKPANTVLTRGGVKLLDFGIAQAASDSNLTGNMAIGTPACMAPEQLTGRGTTSASDVYALGCVLYWCLTGRPPYDTSDINQVAHSHVYAPPPPLNVPGLPPGVTEVYLRCMSKDPAQRPSATEVYARLAQAAAAGGVPLPQQTMVMPAFEPLAQQTQLVAGPLAAGQRSGSGYGGGGGRRSGPRTTSGFRLLIGAVVIAAAAAGVTAMLVQNPAGKTASGAGATASTHASASAAASTPAASPSPSPSPSPSQVQNIDPAANPIGYLEAMRAQINTFIAQGQDTIDPNTGADLQNSLADLENSITSAQQNNSNRQLRQVQAKIQDVEQKIQDDFDNGDISQDAGTQLDNELQNLSDAIANGNLTVNNGGNGNNGGNNGGGNGGNGN